MPGSVEEVRVFGPELNDQRAQCLLGSCFCFSRSFSSIKLAVVMVLPEAAAPSSAAADPLLRVTCEGSSHRL